MLDGQPGRAVALGRALRATASMTVGFTATFALFGFAVAPIAASAQRYVPWFTVLLGLVVAVAGLWVTLGRRLPVTLPGRGRPRRPPISGAAGCGTRILIHEEP